MPKSSPRFLKKSLAKSSASLIFYSSQSFSFFFAEQMVPWSMLRSIFAFYPRKSLFSSLNKALDSIKLSKLLKLQHFQSISWYCPLIKNSFFTLVSILCWFLKGFMLLSFSCRPSSSSSLSCQKSFSMSFCSVLSQYLLFFWQVLAFVMCSG